MDTKNILKALYALRKCVIRKKKNVAKKCFCCDRSEKNILTAKKAIAPPFKLTVYVYQKVGLLVVCFYIYMCSSL